MLPSIAVSTPSNTPTAVCRRRRIVLLVSTNVLAAEIAFRVFEGRFGIGSATNPSLSHDILRSGHFDEFGFGPGALWVSLHDRRIASAFVEGVIDRPDVVVVVTAMLLVRTGGSLVHRRVDGGDSLSSRVVPGY